MTRNHANHTGRLRALTLAAAVGAALMLAPPATADQARKAPKRTQITQQAAPAKQKAARAVKQKAAPAATQNAGAIARQNADPVRTRAARGQQNGRTDPRERARPGIHNRSDATDGRGREHDHDRNDRRHDRERGDHDRRRGWGRDHDRKPDYDKDCKPDRRHDHRDWGRKDRDDCDTNVVVVVERYKPAPCPDLLGTIHINDICVDVRKDHAFEAFREAARCAGYRSEKVRVDGRSYLRIYGCPRVEFRGAGYELDVIRYHNDVIDIALFREVC